MGRSRVVSGFNEIMFGLHGISNRLDAEAIQRVEEEIVAAFD